MPRPSIDYLNTRRALLPANGGTNYRAHECAQYCPDRELDPWDRLDAQCDSAWSDCRIRAEAMWQQIFERFGYLQPDHIDEIPF